jgi:hypothetical protein
MISYLIFPILIEYLVTGYLKRGQLEEQALSDVKLDGLVKFENTLNLLETQGLLTALPVVAPVEGITPLALKKISDCKDVFLNSYATGFLCYSDSKRRGGRTSDSLYHTRMQLLRGLNQEIVKDLQENYFDEQSDANKKLEFCRNHMEPRILLELISICCKAVANNEAAKPFFDRITEIEKILLRPLESRTTDKEKITYPHLWQREFLEEIVKLFKDEKITSKFLNSSLAERIERFKNYDLKKNAPNKRLRVLVSSIVFPILIEYVVSGCLQAGEIETQTDKLESLEIFKVSFEEAENKWQEAEAAEPSLPLFNSALTSARVQEQESVQVQVQEQVPTRALAEPARPSSPLRNFSLLQGSASSPHQRSVTVEQNPVEGNPMQTMAIFSNRERREDSHKRPPPNVGVEQPTKQSRLRYLFSKPGLNFK